MRIIKFSARGIHGYLNQSINFDQKLTFLTGINGSGKSSVIYSIAALLGPSLETLASIEFKQMTLTVENERRRTIIHATRDDQKLNITIDGVEGTLLYAAYDADVDEPPYRTAELSAEYYKNVISQNLTNSVFVALQQLPAPMFLDLSRRSLTLEPRIAAHFVRRRREKNVFNPSATPSLAFASELAESEWRKNDADLRRISIRYRRKLILNLLKFSPHTFGGPIRKPTNPELKKIKRLRSQIPFIPKILGISDAESENNLRPLLDMMESWASKIPEKLSLEEILETAAQKERGDMFDALVSWSANVSVLDKIDEMIDIVEKHNEEGEAASRKWNQYLGAVNKFFRDSKKRLKFSDTGLTSFQLEGGTKLRPIGVLSSGEAQIFVLLTHLFFDPAAQRANIYIVDEPELSLHLAWQEIFVESITSANPHAQYILATHSPSIILDRIDACRDLGESAQFEA